MNFSVCVDAVYHGYDFVESMQELNSAGFRAFEFWSWWDKDLDQIHQAKKELDLECAAMCTHFISLVDAERRSDYLAGLRQSIKVAKILGCKTLISQVGDELAFPREEQKQNLINGLRECAPLLKGTGVQLVFEPLNVRVDHPGYFLTRSDEAFEIAKAVNSPQVKVLFDIYHQQITEGDVIRNIVENINLIGHFHAAGNPGRHELTVGELNYAEIFQSIDETGYKGYMGLEYFPREQPSLGLTQLIA